MAYRISTGAPGVEFLDRDGVTVARIVNRGGKGRWFATPAAYEGGVLRNTDEDVQIDVTRLHNRQEGPAQIAAALGL